MSIQRFGFNGKEKDDEVQGSGNSVDYGARVYDSRLGRWLSVDPLARKFSDLSSYCYVGNSPIDCLDPDGKDIKPASDHSQEMIAAAFLVLFKSTDIMLSFINFNSKSNQSQIIKPRDIIYQRNITQKQFNKDISRIGKKKNVKFSRAEKQSAWDAYALVISSEVTEVWVTESSSMIDDGVVDMSQGNTSDTKLKIEGPNLLAVFRQLQQDEISNTSTDQDGNRQPDTEAIRNAKELTLKGNTNSNGVGRLSNEILIDTTNPPNPNNKTKEKDVKVDQVAGALSGKL